MKKEIRLVLVVCVVLTAVLTALALVSCDVSAAIGLGQAKPDAWESWGDGTVYDESAYGEVVEGADGKATLSVTIQEAASGSTKSVAGLGKDDIKTGAAQNIINYHELIMINNSDISKIAEFDAISGTSPVKLRAGIAIGNTYHILVLSGHKDGNDKPTLLASSYSKERLSVGNTRITFKMTPAVVDAAFVEDSITQEARQPGRLVKTVGLDAGKAYRLRYIIGSADEGVVSNASDTLKKAKGNGLTPLLNAEGGTTSGMGFWDDLTLLSNKAFFKPTSGAQVELQDISNIRTPSGSGNNTTTGEAEYPIANVGSAGTTGNVYFNMEYVPFGKLGTPAWANSTEFHTSLSSAPVWVIRNGLNDTSGAIGFGVVPAGGVAAQTTAGIYEDNNPYPLLSLPGTSSDLTTALTALNSVGTTARYGHYTVKLAAQPIPPEHITLGDGSGVPPADYPAIGSIGLIVEGLGNGIELEPVDDLWTLNSGNTLSYGKGVTAAKWTTFVYNTTYPYNPAADTTVRLREDAGWVGAATPEERLKLLSTNESATSKLKFNGTDYMKLYIRRIRWGSEVKGATVLGDYFLYNFTGLTALDLSPLASVGSIGTYFLNACMGLTALDLSPLAGVSSIGTYSLYGCLSLTKLDMSPMKELTSIGDLCLGNCAQLTKLILPPMKQGASIGSYFLTGTYRLAELDLSPLKELTKFDSYFLEDCFGLIKLDLSPLVKITRIGSYFLRGCTSLTTLKLPPLAGPTIIDHSFLSNCTALTALDMSPLALVDSIGGSFLYHCERLSSVNMGGIVHTKIPQGNNFYLNSTIICTVKVIGDPQDWFNRFTTSAGVSFTN
jgi:hypothetical protein